MAININYDMMNEAQYEAVTMKNEHSLVVSVPGSGKSQILVNRIAHLVKEGVDPKSILAITFSRTAANNMVERLKKIAPEQAESMTVNTFHAITYRLLKANVDHWRNSRGMSRSFEVKRLICEIVVKTLKLESKDSDVDVSSIVHFITMQKNHTLSPYDKLIKVPKMPYSIESMQKIYKLYESNKVKHKLITFDDMVYEGYKLIRDNDNIRKQLQDRYKYILVDESNDLTKLQYELITLIGLKANSVSIIGDNSQEIFQFIGASNKHMKNFVSDFHNVKVINSNINYRSQAKIVDCYNKFLLKSPETKYKYYAPAKAFKPEGKDVEYNVFFNAIDEAKWIADKIQELVQKDKKYSYGDMMILYRTNSQSRAFEELFAKNEIPYHLEGGISFYDRKEIKDMIAYLQLIEDENNDEAWDRVVNVPNRYFGNVFKQEVAEYARKNKCSMYEAMTNFPRRKEWRYKKGIEEFELVIKKCKSVSGRYKVSTILETIRNILKYDDYISKEYDGAIDNTKVDNLNSFTSQASDYKDISIFLKSITIAKSKDEDTTTKQHKSKKPKVQMKSMHCSKGDQAPVVFVVGFSEGIIPHRMNGGNIEAERLLGYVALSRAEEEMYVSSILNHNQKEIEVSSFLYDCFDEYEIEEKVEKCVKDFWDNFHKDEKSKK
jgi:DNA helicase II / ATP-dependent DNA helicase PcrA